jgi:hypothetical protein
MVSVVSTSLKPTRGVEDSTAGGEFQLFHPPEGTVAAVSVSLEIAVTVPSVTDVKVAPFDTVIGIRLVQRS